MRKKVIATVLATSMILSLVACSNSDGKSTTPTDEPTSSDVVQTEEAQTEVVTTTQPEETELLTQETSLANLEAYLLEQGVVSGQRTELAASMIGGISGFKYADSGIEVYEFDENSEQYKKFATGESVEIEGMAGFFVTATAVNGKYVLIASNGKTIEQGVIDIFNSYE